VPSSVEIISTGCFSGWGSLSGVLFPSAVLFPIQSDSKLSRIKHAAFRGCSLLSSFCIAPEWNHLGACAFSGTRIAELLVDPANTVFEILLDGLLAFEKWTALQFYVGEDSEVIIPSFSKIGLRI
jgi:hypothetical protein